MTSTTIDNAGVPLHVTQDGDPANPPVLLLHGIISCSATWEWLVPQLTERFHVVRLDFRGHGLSGRAPGAYHLPDYVSDAVAACEQVVGGPCQVVGHSLGGGTAAALAQQRPDLVTGVVLEDPALMGADDATDADLEGNALLGVFTMLHQVLPMVQAQGMSVEALTELARSMPTASGAPFADLLHADAIVALATGLLQVDPTVLDRVMDRTMVPAFDPSAAIPVPGLVLAADPSKPDAVVRQRDRDRLAAASPLIEVRVVQGAGHLIHDELAGRATFAEATIDFLTTHRQG